MKKTRKKKKTAKAAARARKPKAVAAPRARKQAGKKRVVKAARKKKKNANTSARVLTAAFIGGTTAGAMTETASRPPAVPLAVTSAVAPTGALGGAATPERRLRDDPRFTELAGPDIVPLSRSRHVAIWAFELVDALAAATGSGAGAVGTTRIFALPDDIELATDRNRSGLVIPRTCIAAPTTADPDPKPQLVRLSRGTLNPDVVTGLRFENELYLPEVLPAPIKGQAIHRIALSPSARYPFPYTSNDPLGRLALLRGQTPEKFGDGARASVSVVNPPPRSKGAAGQTGAGRRFLLWEPAASLLATPVPGVDPPAFELKLDIDASAGRKLKLTYRLTRRDVPKDANAPPAPQNTPRTKLIHLDASAAGSPIQAEDVPPLELVLI